MKKIYFLLTALFFGAVSNAQTIPNAGMETWRSTTSGTDTVIDVYAPVDWFGFDSLIIADGQTYKSFIGSGNDWHAQLFQEGTIVHGGSSSAKLMTLQQDVVGIVPGLLSNAQVSVDVLSLFMGGTLATATKFTGGLGVTSKITTVSAYVEYLPGLDTITHKMGGLDTATLTVQAYALIHGNDSLIGTGFVQIPPSGAFTQITATIAYTDTVDSVGILRILFASSGGGSGGTLDSSTLYVDDLTMTSIAEPPPIVNAVHNVMLNDAVTVYPNPATGVLNIKGLQYETLTCKLFAVNGQVVAAETFTGNTSLDVSYLPNGLYFYAIVDEQGITVQRGKIIESK